MRLLAIGSALPHIDIDNYSALTAPSYFDYDALYVDPVSITAHVKQLLDGAKEFEAFDGRPVLNTATTATAVSIADQLRRRVEETQRLLESGGVVIVAGRPNATLGGVTGFEGCDRYSWLPAPAGMAWAPPHLKAAEGKTIRIIQEEHPLATLLRDYRRELGVRAVFDDRLPAGRQAGRVIATGGWGVPHTVEFAVLAGKVIFMPAIIDELGYFRSEFAEKLMDAVAHIAGTARVEPAPSWAAGLALPGLERLEAELEAAKRSAEEASARLETTREQHDTLATHRRLLTEDGRGLLDAVSTALQLLGFTVYRAEGGGLEAATDDQTVFVECEGSRDDVVEWPYVRLQRRLEKRLLADGGAAKGIVVANGHRHLPPDDRPDRQWSEPLRIACENYQYTLVSSNTLFGLVQRALGGADEAALTGMRRRLMGASGLLELAMALGEVGEEKDAGQIF